VLLGRKAPFTHSLTLAQLTTVVHTCDEGIIEIMSTSYTRILTTIYTTLIGKKIK